MKRPLYLWPVWLVARRAGVRYATVIHYHHGRLVSGFAMRRIEDALNRLEGMQPIPGGGRE